MLNYETIKSVYDDKLTLLQWLKKVEEALKNATAVEFKVNKRGSATLTFSIVFDDGTELETSDIVLQQGESVTGAAIVNGHLKLTLSNGDVLDAGNLGGVSSFSIDASQHLIVHYQNGSTQDLGAIFQGNISIAGTITATGKIKSNDDIEADGSFNGASASITGLIMGGEIIENMSGYSAVINSRPELQVDNVYTSVCKNGNKLTFVGALKLTRLAELGSGFEFIVFTIPDAVGAKLYPVNIAGGDFLDNKIINAFSSASNYVAMPSYMSKYNNHSLGMTATRTSINNLTLNTEYYFRYEATFLLNDDISA